MYDVDNRRVWLDDPHRKNITFVYSGLFVVYESNYEPYGPSNGETGSEVAYVMNGSHVLADGAPD